MTSIPASALGEVRRQHAILSRGTAAIYPGPDRHGFDGLHYKLATSLIDNRPLKVKFGMDPTAPDLHLGHCVVLSGMRRFQELGHIAQPLIGDYTARIGDPSGRNKTRLPLTSEQIDANARTYFEQVFRILESNSDRFELLYNGQWLSKLSFAETIKLCAQVTVAQILSREDFATRLSANTPISMHELIYPIMQGYDSVVMNCDVELGGTDQTFNCLMGRQLMQARGLEPQVVVTFPLLEGTDGVEKMSKSTGQMPPRRGGCVTVGIPQTAAEPLRRPRRHPRDRAGMEATRCSPRKKRTVEKRVIGRLGWKARLLVLGFDVSVRPPAYQFGGWILGAVPKGAI